jgi:hypothetical protein
LEAVETAEKYLGYAYDAGCRTWPETTRAMESMLGEEIGSRMVRLLHSTWEIRFRPLIAAEQRRQRLEELDVEIDQMLADALRKAPGGRSRHR